MHRENNNDTQVWKKSVKSVNWSSLLAVRDNMMVSSKI